MEIFEGKEKTDETLSGVSTISQPNDDPNAILKLGLEETVGDDLGLVVVKTTLVEKTEISDVKMIQDDEFMKNQEQGEENEVIVNEKERVCVDLVDDDGDGDENGTSEAMDVEGSLAGVNLLFEGDAGFLGDEHGENASGDPMEIGLPVEEDKNDENGIKVFEWKDETDKNDEVNVEIREDNASELAEKKGEFIGEQGENEEEEEDHGFVVGEFVWGKIKSHTWWPGQIYDPFDASANAIRLKQKGGLLVAYFGDRSFSWCSPSQLKPFIDHFTEMSNQSDSKKFVNAVQMALEEVSRLVEAGLMCKCQTGDRVGSGVVNRGIKKGVPVPKGNTIKVLMDRIRPVELLLTLKASATMVPGTGLAQLELTLLKSCLNAFYSKKGGYLLVSYHDPKFIEGLEDEKRSGVGVIADSDINTSSESIDNSDDKLYQTRKQKSVAELLREDEPKIKKTKTSTDGGSGKRKRKALVVSVTPESDHESGGGGVEEETMSPRQRKKSKYLSPPYLSPVVGGKHSVFGSGPGSGSGSGSGSFKESKVQPEKVPEMAAKHLEDSLKKSSGKKTHQKKGACDGSDSQEEQKTIDTAVNVSKVLHGLLRVALDPTSFMAKNLPAITDFISWYRNSVFGEGSSYQTDEKKNARNTSDLTFIKQKQGSSYQTDQKKNARGTLDLAFIKQKQGSSYQRDQKKNAWDASDLAFIKQKLESMIEIVQRCEEGEMNADVKASLSGGMQEVLQKVGKMKGN